MTTVTLTLDGATNTTANPAEAGAAMRWRPPTTRVCTLCRASGPCCCPYGDRQPLAARAGTEAGR